MIKQIKEKQNEVFRRINNFVMSEAIISFFDNSPDLFAVINNDEKLLVINKSFTNELGWSFEELTEKSFYNFIPDNIKEKLKKDIADKKSIIVNFMTCKDGSTKKIKWRIVYDDEKQYMYATGRIISDTVVKLTENFK